MKIPSWAVASAALVSVVLIAVGASAAQAAGSNDPIPYSVTAAGLTLPAGDTFTDDGHVNIEYTVNGVTESASVHFESLNNQPSGQFIGTSYLPWSYLIPDASYCITWVQLSQYNQHFGEGGQSPVCTTGTPTSTPTATSTPSSTPTLTSTPTPTSIPTATSTPTLTPTATSTSVPAVVSAPVSTPSPSGSVTPIVDAPLGSADVSSPTVLASTGINASTPIALAIAAAAILIGAAMLFLRRRRLH